METLENTSLEFAITNMRQFMAELIETFGPLNWQYIGGGKKPRHNSGWFGFEVVVGHEIVAIDMPGCDPEMLSPTADEESAPNIFINGSPWGFGFALKNADDEIRNIIIDNWISENKASAEAEE